MASDPDQYLGRDVYTYSQQKEEFQRDLFKFHFDRGTQFLSLPSVSGKAVDLYRLYLLVTKNGGFHKVCDRNLWWKITPELFHFPPACANAELALKQLYMRYLYLYERVYLHGEDPDYPDDEDSGPRGSKTSRILVHQVPMTYNYRQHRVQGSSRRMYGLSTDTVRPNEYERLEKSLLSGLPNEVDFAINVCCILSMDGPNAIKLLTHRRLIELLLAHVALFSDTSTLQPLYHKEWFPKTQRNFTQFWYEAVEHANSDYGPDLLDMISCEEHRLDDQKYYLNKQKCLIGSEILHLGRDRTDCVLRRVQQVSNIIRNLSFDAASARALSESELVFNFAMLSCHCSLPELKTNGMDILANISKMYVLPSVQETSTQLIVRSLHRWIHSQDKLELVNSLLIIAALSQVEQNEESLVEGLSADFYSQIVSLARLYDLQLIIAALDALYFLSEIGEATCEAISLVKHCIDFLANLVTVETQSFGESALGGIIVRDHGIPSSQLAQPGQHPPRPVGTSMGPPATPYTNRPMSRPGLLLGQSPLPHQMSRSAHTPPQHPIPPHHNQPTPPYRASATKSGLGPLQRTILPATPQNLATMSPDQVACNWVRANYEPYPGALAITAKVHQEYVLWLQRRGGAAAMPVSPGTFVNCIKKVFPYSDLVMNGPESQISGVRWKPPQTLPTGAPNNQVPPQVRPVQGQPPAYLGQHILSSGGSPAAGMPPRISSPSSNAASSDMLRNMLLNSESSGRQRSNSGTSSSLSSTKQAKDAGSSRSSRRGRGSRSTSPRSRSFGDSPLPPVSPVSTGSMELQVCGSAEKVESFVNGASLARIERVENPQSPAHLTSSSSANDEKAFNNKISNNDLSDNPTIKQNGGVSPTNDLKTGNSVSSTGDNAKPVEEDNDSAMDTSERDSMSFDPHKTNGNKENGPHTPSEALSSPPICNGNTSDTDSLLTEPSKHNQKLVNGVSAQSQIKVNGGGDSVEKTFPAPKNGYINDLEKMIASITDDKPKSNLHRQISEHRRHHSGDSLASQSSTSTQLSVSQNSQSSDQKQELSEQASNQLSFQASLANQRTVQPPANINQHSTSITKLLTQPSPIANQLHAQNSAANQMPAQHQTPNNIPTVVESVANHKAVKDTAPKAAPFNKQIVIPSGPLTTVLTGGSDVSQPLRSPLASPGASGKKAGRKRRRSTASTDSKQSASDAVLAAPGQHKCLWECCGLGFGSCSLLRKHVSASHTNRAGACLWAGCDRVERKRWALVSHVNERHTSDVVLAKALANREKGILPAQASQAPTSLYTPQAAKTAILRNFPKPPYPELVDAREGPVTKHIRFTAALILRNLCRYSPTGRTLLKKHESNLAAIAGSTMEASTAIVNCLWEIQQSQYL